MNKRKCLCLVLALCLVFGLVVPNNLYAQAATQTYDFNDMAYSTSYGTAYSVDADGTLSLTFEGQYQEIRYSFPTPINMNLCNSITVSAETEDSLAFKLYDDAGEQVFVEYGFSATEKSAHTMAPVLDGTVTEFAVMLLADATDVSAKLYDIKVDMISADFGPDTTDNKTTYTFHDMIYSSSYGTEYFVNDSGALQLVFEGQYQEIRYSFPELLDMTLCNGITITAEAAESLAVKLYDAAGEEVFVQYGVSAAEKTSFTFAPVLDCKVSEFAVMLLADATDASATIYDITLDMASADSTVSSDTLLSTYGTLFGRIGNCVSVAQLQNSRILNTLKAEYNSVTLENEMKPDHILGSTANLITVNEAVELGYYIPAGYTDTTVPKLNFTALDTAMQICSENGLGMRGHTLVWHSQTPTWLFREDYNASADFVSADVMDARMEFFVKSVIHHVYDSNYGDCVYAWDVVNEYFHATNSGWEAVYGETDNTPDFVKKAFLFAHEALVKQGVRDEVSLFYNDYNTYMVADDIVTMVKYVNAETQLCDGIGMQSHLDTAFPNASYYCDALKKFCDTGLEVQITELDVTNTSDAIQATYCYNLLSGILDIYKDGGNITGLTVWGLYDSVSWRADKTPTLNSNLSTKKQAYTYILEAYKDAGYTTDAEPTPVPTATTAPTATPVPTATPAPVAGINAEVTYATYWGNGGQVEITLTNDGESLSDDWTVALDLNIDAKLTNSWGDGYVADFEDGRVTVKNQSWQKGFATGATKKVYLQYEGTLPDLVTCSQNTDTLAASVRYVNHWGNGGQIEVSLENSGDTLTDGWAAELDLNVTGKLTGTWGDGYVTDFENGHVVIANQTLVPAFSTGSTKSIYLQFEGRLPIFASNATIQ